METTQPGRPGGGRRASRSAILLVAIVLLASLPVLLRSVDEHRPPPPPAPGELLWSSNLETGDLSQWTELQSDEAVFNTGTGQVAPTQEVARTGDWSLRLSVIGADGEAQAARIFRWAANPVEAYYSVWLYFPERSEPRQWWNVVQFKSQASTSDPIWIVNVGNRRDGDMFFYLWDALSQRSYARQLEPTEIPVGHWFRVTAYYRRATDQTGRIVIWQDDHLLYDIGGVQTAIADNVHWGIGNYSDNLPGGEVVIYADDAEIRDIITATPIPARSQPAAGARFSTMTASADPHSAEPRLIGTGGNKIAKRSHG